MFHHGAVGPDIAKIADLVFSGGTALAGLVLVYLGFLLQSFETYRPDQREELPRKIKQHTYAAMAGLIASLVAAALAFISFCVPGMMPSFVYPAAVALVAISFPMVGLTAVLQATRVIKAAEYIATNSRLKGTPKWP
jgi:tellurite resistance protein TehA-like permease